MEKIILSHFIVFFIISFTSCSMDSDSSSDATSHASVNSKNIFTVEHSFNSSFKFCAKYGNNGQQSDKADGIVYSCTTAIYKDNDNEYISVSEDNTADKSVAKC